MKTRQITLPGRGNVRVRVITWNEGEAARLYVTQTPVPNLHDWDDTHSKLFRRYRIKQVMADGTESPWLVQRRLSVRVGYDKSIRIRLRPVSRTGQFGDWQYVSVHTGSRPGDPGNELLELFVRDFLGALGDDFLDRVQLDVAYADQAEVHPQDHKSTYALEGHFVEAASLDGMQESVKVLRDLLKEYLVEYVAIQLSVPLEIIKTYRAALDQAALRAIDNHFDAILKSALWDLAELVTQESVTVTFGDGSAAGIRSKVDINVLRELAAAWVRYLTEDQTLVRCLDAIKYDLHAWWTEEVQFRLAEYTSWLELMKRLFAEEELEIKLGVLQTWELRRQIFSQIALRIIEAHAEQLHVSLRDAPDFRLGSYVQAVTDDGGAYIHDRHNLSRLVDRMLQALAISQSDAGRLAPVDASEWAFIQVYREVLDGLHIDETVKLQLLTAAAFELVEVLDLTLDLGLTQTLSVFRHDVSSPFLILAGITHLGLEFAEQANFVPRDMPVSYEMGEQIGASLDAFIMGRFIMGVTPMGRVGRG